MVVEVVQHIVAGSRMVHVGGQGAEFAWRTIGLAVHRLERHEMFDDAGLDGWVLAGAVGFECTVAVASVAVAAGDDTGVEAAYIVVW